MSSSPKVFPTSTLELGRTVCQFIMATNLQAHPLLYYAALHLITCVEIEI